MQPSPHPPTRRPHTEERPRRDVRADLRYRVDKGASAAVQPLDGAVGIARWLAVTHGTWIEIILDPVTDDLGCPAVTPADMPKQLLNRPPRTGRHRRRLIGDADELTEQLVLLEQGCDVIHNEIISSTIELLKVGGGRDFAPDQGGGSAIAM